MTLTDAERLKFADYCDRSAADAEGIAKQMATLPGPMMEVLVKRERAKAAAYRIVSNHLRNAESMTLREPTPDTETR
jgi:hypothetical protein